MGLLLQRLKRATLHAIIFLMLPLSLSAGANEAEIPDNVTQLRQLAQLAEYIGVDYAEAVKNGQVINDNEYQEMVEFSQLIVTKSSLAATADAESLAVQAKALQRAIHDKKGVDEIRQMSASLRGTLLGLMPHLSLPERISPQEKIRPVFETNCGSCHGVSK